jgi:hypothetical protein
LSGGGFFGVEGFHDAEEVAAGDEAELICFLSEGASFFGESFRGDKVSDVGFLGDDDAKEFARRFDADGSLAGMFALNEWDPAFLGGNEIDAAIGLGAAALLDPEATLAIKRADKDFEIAPGKGFEITETVVAANELSALPAAVGGDEGAGGEDDGAHPKGENGEIGYDWGDGIEGEEKLKSWKAERLKGWKGGRKAGFYRRKQRGGRLIGWGGFDVKMAATTKRRPPGGRQEAGNTHDPSSK